MNLESRNNESSHPESQELLSALLDGQLTAEQAIGVRERLEREPQLRELYAQLESQRAQLRGLQRVAASGSFASRVAAEIRERAVVVDLPREAGDEDGPRGGWRSVYLLAGSLAAVLLLGVFLWPRQVADNSAQVAQTDAQIRRKELDARAKERDVAMNAAEPAPAAVRRAPAGMRPETRGGAAADGGVEVGEVAGGLNSELTANHPGDPRVAEQPVLPPGERSAIAGVEVTGQGLPGGPGLAGGAGVAGGSGSVGSAGGAFGEAGAMPQLSKLGAPAVATLEEQPAAKSANAQASEKMLADAAPRAEAGLDESGIPGAAVPNTPMDTAMDRVVDSLSVIAAEQAAGANLEVWLVDAGDSPRPAAGVEGLNTGSNQATEVYLTRVEQTELPAWLEELRMDAVVTQLDSGESAELLRQLQTKGKLPVGPGAIESQEFKLEASPSSAAAAAESAKPSNSAAAILDDRPSDLTGNKLEQKTGDKLAAELSIAYLELEQPAEIEAVINRSNARQSGGQYPAGGGGGGQGVIGGNELERNRMAGRAQRSGLESNLSQLRSQAYQRQADSRPGAGRQALQQQGQASDSDAPSSDRPAENLSRENLSGGNRDAQGAAAGNQAARQIIIIVRPQ